MVVNNPNNWHWVDKNCIQWAQDYFKGKLVGLGFEQDGMAARISSVISVEGDCEINQRKGKLISLYDLQITCEFEGQVQKDGSAIPFKGSLMIPEVAFDSEPDSYQFQINVYGENAQLLDVRANIREQIGQKQMKKVLINFGEDLISTHGKDIQESSGSPNPGVAQGTTQSQNISNTVLESSGSTGTGNSTTVHYETSFQCPATIVYGALMDPQRIMAWSRGSFQGLKVQDGSLLRAGDVFHLFGGNVESEVTRSDPEKCEIEMVWQLKDWPHRKDLAKPYMHISMHESTAYNETRVVVQWTHVPIGQEERVRDNFEEYYVKPIKLTFQLGAVL